MKKRVLAILAGVFLASGLLVAQEITLTEVINKFNDAAASIQGQSYEKSLTELDECLVLCDQVGEEADDMKKKAQEQVVGTNYRQATTLMRRKQYDSAIPFLEATVAKSGEYEAKPELAEKAGKYLPSLYLREGNKLTKQGKLDEAMLIFDKALAMSPNLYKLHQGKGLVYKEQDEIDLMLEEYAIAKEKAAEKGDAEFIASVNKAIDGHYNGLIQEELMMMDPEEPDFTYLYEVCDLALSANETNGFAAWQAGMAKNKEVLYDEAIAYLEPVVDAQTDPNMVSAVNYELGVAYQNTVRYEEACACYNKVTEEPFLTKAEKKMMTSNCQ